MKVDRVVFPRPLESADVVCNTPVDQGQPVTSSIHIELPIIPASLAAQSDDYVMYAAYYVRQNCPADLSPNDMTFRVVRRREYLDYLCAATLENKAIGKYGITASIEEDKGEEELSARRMMFKQLEQTYKTWRRDILQAAINRQTA